MSRSMDTPDQEKRLEGNMIGAAPKNVERKFMLIAEYIDDIAMKGHYGTDAYGNALIHIDKEAEARLFKKVSQFKVSLNCPDICL